MSFPRDLTMWPAKRLTATCDVHRKPARAFGDSPVVPRSTLGDPGEPAFRPFKLEHLSLATDASQLRARAPRRHHLLSHLSPGPEGQRPYFTTPEENSNVLRKDPHEEAALPGTYTANKKVGFEKPDEDKSSKAIGAEGDSLATAQHFDAPLEYSAELASRLRWKQVLQAYYFLDPWDKGYIDLDEACTRLGNLQASDEELADFLLQILEDTIPLISSRGIIEKKSFLRTVRSWVEEDFATPGPYILLRSAINPVNKACRKGMFPTYLAEKFFEGTYLPQGVVRTASLDQRFLSVEGQGQRKNLNTLSLHGELSRQRKCQTIRKHQLDKARKDADELTFKPSTTKYKHFSSACVPKQNKKNTPVRRPKTEILYDFDDTVERSLAGCSANAILRSPDGTIPNIPRGEFTSADIWVKFDGDPKPGVQSKWRHTLRKDPSPIIPSSPAKAEISSRESRCPSEKGFNKHVEDVEESFHFNNPYQLAHSSLTGQTKPLENDFLLKKQKAHIEKSITRACHGDYTSGLKHKSKSTSEWVHELRGGFLPSQIDASTNGLADRIRMPTSTPGPAHRALNKHSMTPNS